MGGGTFDVSVIRVDGQNVEVIATNGVAKLGGDDFDHVILQLVKRNYEQQAGKEMESDDFTLNDAEEEKKSLSKRKRTTVRVGKQLVDITREQFEEGISSKIACGLRLCRNSANSERANSDLESAC